jgi:hypothetical protein
VESSHANWRRYIYRVLVIAYSESCDTHAMNLWGERQIRAATNSKLLSQELVDTMTEHDIADTAISHINYVYGRESLQMERTGDVPSGILQLSATKSSNQRFGVTVDPEKMAIWLRLREEAWAEYLDARDAKECEHARAGCGQVVKCTTWNKKIPGEVMNELFFGMCQRIRVFAYAKNKSKGAKRINQKLEAAGIT